MNPPPVWEFAIEIHPPEWRCPASPFWIAGWIDGGSAAAAADVRAWIDNEVFLGLCALPRPDVEQRRIGRRGPPHLGFSFLLEPFRGARQLRLEVCDERGRWHPLGGPRAITVDAGAPEHPHHRLPDTALARAIPRLLRLRHRQRGEPCSKLAEEALISELARPLNTLPNPPFYGRLEEPAAVGRVKYGRLTLTGWIAHREQLIHRLFATIDPHAPVPLLHGLPRRDMTGIFAKLRGADRSQFIGHVDLPGALPQPLALRIFAELEDGSTELAFTQRFRSAAATGSVPQYPPYSFARFASAAWAVWQKGRRIGRGGLTSRELIAALATAHADYRAEAPPARPRLRGARPAAPPPGAPLPPLRVVVVTHNLNFEGAPLFAFEYARHLASRPGWSVRIVSPKEGPLRSSLEAAGLEVDVIDVEKILGATSAGAFDAAVRELALSVAWKTFDVVVANTIESFWAVHAARAAGRPAVLYIHESAVVRRHLAPVVDSSLLARAEAALGAARRTVFIAAASLRVHARHEHRRNYRCLPSWIAIDRIDAYSRAHSKAELRARLGLPPDAIVFVNVGSVCERKGQHIFVRAIDHLLGSAPARCPLRFLMVGGRPGPYADSLRHDITLRNLTGVEIVEEVPDAYAYYRMADIAVCSSFEESFPRVLMEAAAFRLPIVSTEVDGVSELLTPDDAWLVQPGDAAGLAGGMRSALEAVLAGDDRRARRAREAVEKRHNASRVLPQHAALLAEAAAGKTAG